MNIGSIHNDVKVYIKLILLTLNNETINSFQTNLTINQLLININYIIKSNFTVNININGKIKCSNNVTLN